MTCNVKHYQHKLYETFYIEAYSVTEYELGTVLDSFIIVATLKSMS